VEWFVGKRKEFCGGLKHGIYEERENGLQYSSIGL
jgi:hypothetical protein